MSARGPQLPNSRYNGCSPFYAPPNSLKFDWQHPLDLLIGFLTLPPNPFLWNNLIFVPMIKFNYVSRDKEKFSEPVTIFLSHPTEVLQNSHLKILGIVNMASDN